MQNEASSMKFWQKDFNFCSTHVYGCPINASPSSFCISLTVTDSDGATNSTQATLSVNKAKDYRPVANAGPNQVCPLCCMMPQPAGAAIT